MTHRLLLAALAACALFGARPCFAQRPAAALPEGIAVETNVEYGKAGDQPLLLDIYRPKQEAAQPRPCIVWIHGGGWQNGDKATGRGRLASVLGDGKYVGVSVGYRLTDKGPFPAQIHDCKAAIRWVRANAKKYGIDPDRIGVWGSSAGGHLVSLLGTSGDVAELEGTNGSPGVSSRVTCVVDYCGPADFLLMRDAAAVNKAGSAVFKLLGGPVAEKQEVAQQASPIAHVSQDDPPFLVVHGTNDALVPLVQAERFYEALKKGGVDATLVKIEGGGHGIGGKDVEDRVRAFFARHLLKQDVAVSGDPIKQTVGGGR